MPLGSRVVHYGIKNGLHLNYYRTGGVKLVHGVDPDADEGMLFNVGGQAGVPVTSQKSGYGARLPQEAGSMDAAVSIDALGQQGSAAEIDASLAEAARVLRPGSPFVFFEHGSGGEALVAALERSAAFRDVIADKQWATYALAKHSIGLAFRTGAAVGSAAAGGAALTGRAAAAAAFVAKTQQAKIQAALGGKMPSFDDDEEEETAAGEAAPQQPPPPPPRKGKGKGGRRR